MPISLFDNKPVVTVICLCYNHAAYIKASLDSVLNQTYKNIEIVIVNDFSTDDSSIKIKEWLADNSLKNIRFIDNPNNLGHTKSFNKAYKYVNGEFIIDLATDDLLTPTAVENHIKNFDKNLNAGISYSNIEYVTPKGKHYSYFYKVDENTFYKFDFSPKSGNLYNELLATFYLSACGMCVAKRVYDTLEGYDESLDYEDFDFWVRSSFKFEYVYSNFISLKKRILETSHSSLSQTQLKNRYRKDKSTFKVCVKAYHQNNQPSHYKSLLKRVYHEIKIVAKSKNIYLTIAYSCLYFKTKCKIFQLQFIKS